MQNFSVCYFEPQILKKLQKKDIDIPGFLWYYVITSGGKATEDSEAHVSNVSPDNTLKWLVKLGATRKGRGSLLKKIFQISEFGY